MPNKKREFDLDIVITRIRKENRSYPKAMLFELADRGFSSPFQILVACILSIRTLDEVSLKISLNLLSQFPQAKNILQLHVKKLADLIHGSQFSEKKAESILKIAQIAEEQYGGDIPCDEELLLSLPGVGPKCANLVLGIACHQPRIGVDIHVHRVTNRWGYIQAKTPEGTMNELEKKLPRKYWIEINALLVPFGKHVCVGSRPFCSRCPVLEFCRQVGITTHR